MFGIDAPELLVIVIVAILVIGPKDLPLALRTAGRWIGKMRRVSAHFRTGLDAMIREAEMEELERKWKEQNEAIMKSTPAAEMTPINAETMAPVRAEAPAGSAEARLPSPQESPSESDAGEPELPLGSRNG
jgi:sec-independent protein translocase protein TatB